MESLLNWARKNGSYIIDNLAFTNTGKDRVNRTIITLKYIFQDEIIARISPKTRITNETIQKETRLCKWCEKLEEREQTVLFLLYEFQKGKRSNYYHYLELLPSVSDFRSHYPTFMSQEELNISENISEYFVNLVKQLNELNLSLYNKLQELNQKDPIFKYGILTLENVKWIQALIKSRAFEENGNAMVPLGDLFQHSRDANCVYEFDEEQNLIFKANRDIARGEEISISYNDKTDITLLLSYGFSLDDGKANIYFSYTTVLGEINFYSHSLEQSLQNAFYLIRVALLDQETINYLKEINSEFFKQMISRENEKLMLQILINTLQSTFQKQFSTQYIDPTFLLEYNQCVFNLYILRKNYLNTYNNIIQYLQGLLKNLEK
jgi:hypothetical protein